MARSKTLQIRLATAADLRAVYDIYGCSKLDELRFEARSFVLLPLPDDARRHQALCEGELFIAEQGKHSLGFSSLHGAEIRGLFVHPEHRGRGIGRALLMHLLGLVPGEARLYVALSNAPARELYQRHGFAVVREFETEYNGVPVMAAEMRRPPCPHNTSSRP
ncbi:GNAT family N-acetyltransferase [Paucibacter sp. APW11]|uniref:GNAT family N-acetyltransferase n=1 Tax=Roseateles aquae TaxID=3077235 RepID=A0ABU3PIA4_9BURK|nr:GNAT family N-acetyltransferase [Paucibacter sp. APW11]MDT9002288.1 GNAT family N-acetyltransferase [Paucibacter sp. APW11]